MQAYRISSAQHLYKKRKGSGSVPLTSGSGSWWPKYMLIRIPNYGLGNPDSSLQSCRLWVQKFKFWLIICDERGRFYRPKNNKEPSSFRWLVVLESCQNYQKGPLCMSFDVKTSVADPDPESGIGCLFDPWIRNPGWEKVSIRIRDEQPG